MSNDEIKRKLRLIQTEILKLQKDGIIATGETREAFAHCLDEIYFGTQTKSYFRHKEIEKVYNIKSQLPPSFEYAGRLRTNRNRRMIIVDTEILDLFYKHKIKPPSFLEAGPYKKLAFDPENIKVAIVTSGGVAPGLNTVVHNIVSRHEQYTSLNKPNNLEIVGVLGGFHGLHKRDFRLLKSSDTSKWIQLGGCELGTGRDEQMKEKKYREEIIERLFDIDILYVIGGDGSMNGAHNLAGIITKKLKKDRNSKPRSVIGVPKTMDNDIRWCWETFGFETAINEASHIITALHEDVKATKRIGIIQLFGAEAGFVTTFAYLASGVCNAFLIPEMFTKEILKGKSPSLAVNKKIKETVNEIMTKKESLDEIKKEPPHGIIVVAEGVKTKVNQTRDDALKEIASMVEKSISKWTDSGLTVVTNQPRHLIRAIPPTPTDQILCRRLASSAVDCALAGYHDIMVSQLLNEYIMVPLPLVVDLHVKKRVPMGGMLYGMAAASQNGI